MVAEIMNTDDVLRLFFEMVSVDHIWRAEIPTKPRQSIKLIRIDSPKLWRPLPALYYHLTGREIGPSFWFPELEKEYQLPWWEALEIVYAYEACDCSRRFDRNLRNQILVAIGLPEEIITRR